MKRIVVVWLVAGSFIAACLPAAGNETQAPTEASRVVAAKRITAATLGNPGSFGDGTEQAPGKDELRTLVNSGLSIPLPDGSMRAVLAEETPSLENGLWRLLPDGRMETTWRIRRGATWHDGTPFTSADLVFTTRFEQDPRQPKTIAVAYSAIEAIDAPDPSTVRVSWKRPHIQADQLFTLVAGGSAYPAPKHLLEPLYNEEGPMGVYVSPYWTTAFVGTGPYKVRDWVDGSHAVLEAFDGYVLGRPKINQIDVKFILDSKTLAAHILGSEVELVLGRSLSVEQALVVRDQWKEGTVTFGGFRQLHALYPQLNDPTPAVVTNREFRRALMHAIDRQALADTLMGGVSPVPHGWFPPGVPAYREIEERAVRYDYDPGRASQLIGQLGLTPGADGRLRTAAGEPLPAVELQLQIDDFAERLALVVADYWKRVGAQSELFTARRTDDTMRASRTGFHQTRRSATFDQFHRLFRGPVARPENNFRGTSVSQYNNAAFDAMIDRYISTIPVTERLRAAADIVHHMTDMVVLIPLLYDTEPLFTSSRLQNIFPRGIGDLDTMHNVEQWDVQ